MIWNKVLDILAVPKNSFIRISLRITCLKRCRVHRSNQGAHVVLREGKGVEDFSPYQFALHQKLSINYLEVGNEDKATAHLQAAGLLTSGSDDANYTPIYKKAAIYPRRALVRGIEGYVVLEFTVTRAGGVHDPKVIEANPPRIFDQAAIDAVRQFRYIPRVVNGEPVQVTGVTNRIAFGFDG